MLKFGPTGFDPNFLSDPENLNLPERFDAFAADDGPVLPALIPALTTGDSLDGLSLQLDGDFLTGLLFDSGPGLSDHITFSYESLITNDGPGYSVATSTTIATSEQSFTVSQVIAELDINSNVTELPVDGLSLAAEISASPSSVPGNVPGDSGLIFLDFGAFGKGGTPGSGKEKGGGGDGGGGETEPSVLSSYTSGDSGGYNIDINFKGTWTVELQQAFITSSEMISDLITGDISDVWFRGQVIDDIRIDAKLGAIDGEGGILGQAGPTAIRTSNYLPATAIMEFDSADAGAFNLMPSGAEGTLWDDIVTHEMMHSIGFGSIWGFLDLVSNGLFTGENATAAYEADPDISNSGGVPVEQDGGGGTAGSHWDEETFLNEIMTGYINLSDNYLSDMTTASLEDLGYDTVWVLPEDALLV